MELRRRSFLGGLLAVTVATQIPKSWAAPVPVLWGDGIHDDQPALQAFVQGLPFKTSDGFEGAVEEGEIRGGRFLLKQTLDLRFAVPQRSIRGCTWVNPDSEDTICDGWTIPTEKRIS